MQRLSKEEFKETMMKGRPEKGMPNFDGSKMVIENLDGLYAYLKGRADGAIQPGRLDELKVNSPRRCSCARAARWASRPSCRAPPSASCESARIRTIFLSRTARAKA